MALAFILLIWAETMANLPQSPISPYRAQHRKITGMMSSSTSLMSSPILCSRPLQHGQARFLVSAFGDNPTCLAGWERLCEGMRLAGVPEGCRRQSW